MRSLLLVVLLLASCRRTGSESLTSQGAATTATTDSVDVSSTSVFDEKDWEHWIDADGDCQDTRQEVLISSSEVPVEFQTARQCKVASGRWTCPYTGQTFTDPKLLSVAPLVSIASAHTAGGHSWDADKRKNYANRVEGRHLVAISQRAEVSKALQGPERWLPPIATCQYLLDWISIAIQWQLKVDQSVFELHTSRCLEVGNPIVSFNAPTTLDSDSDDLQGYRFTLGADNISVTGLGFFDSSQDGLNNDHPVGIFDVKSEQLIAQAIVPKGTVARLEGYFRYVSIPTVLLLANTTYVALSYRPQSQSEDPITSVVSGLKVLPGITLNSEIGRNRSGGLVFHNSPFGFSAQGWFGPSFLAVVKTKH